MPYKFNPFTGEFDYYEGAAGHTHTDTVTELTTNTTLSSGVEYYQTGAGNLTHTLPGATQGRRIKIYKYGTGTIRINRDGTDTIEDGSTYIENTTANKGYIELYCYAAGEWDILPPKGVWDYA